MLLTISKLLTLAVLLLLLFPSIALSQQNDSVVQVSSKYIESVGQMAANVEEKLDKKTSKAISQLQKQEEKIRRKLAKKDSSKAKELYTNAQQQYASLEQKLQKKTDLQQYIPSLDTLGSSLNFLKQEPQLLSAAKGTKEKLESAIGKLGGMKSQLQKAEEVKKFLEERKQYLKQQLGNLGFVKELKQVNKQAYYYAAQVNEYKSMLKDHKKAARKGLELLGKTKLFQNFMRKNSQLASLFPLPGSAGDPSAPIGLAGLQTRAQINNLIQQQITAGGINAQAQFSQNLQNAQTQLSQLKGKMMSMGGGSPEMEMPDFKPNQQRTKSFLKRLEYGTNIQSQKANAFFPVTTDFGLSVGYKLNDKSIIGIGGSMKVGWGKGFRDIHISSQGVGLRSYLDYKIKGSFWISAGYEMNYRSEINSFSQLQSYSAWQRSGLVGLSKVLSLRTKFFKKTKLQLLWDFLSYQQVPRAQAVIFRVNYNLK